MGAVTIIKNYFNNANDLDLQRFLLNFTPNSHEMLNFQFSYEYPFCNCLVDYSQNTLRGSSSLSYKDLLNAGGAGFYMFGFTLN